MFTYQSGSTKGEIPVGRVLAGSNESYPRQDFALGSRGSCGDPPCPLELFFYSLLVEGTWI